MKHIGFLIPASNIVAERELYTRLVKDELSDISFHFARLKFQTPYGVNEEKYTQELIDSIPITLTELERIKLYKTAVLCTSAEIFAKNTENLLFPLSAVISYLKCINKSHPLIITPYNKNIGNVITQTMQNSGIFISKEIHLDIKNKEDLINFSNTKLLELIENQIDKHIDSICVLCTNFATIHLEKDIEEEFNVPFISSNKAIYMAILK